MAAARTPRQGRTGRAGRQPRIMSHAARRSRAEAPDEAVELAAGEVRRAFEEWASRFVALLVRDLAPTVARQDATIEGIYREVGRAQPRAEKLEQAFRMLDKQSADELRVTGVPIADVIPKALTRKAEWLRANTDLIKAEADLRRRVERIIQDPLNQGRSVSDIAKLLEEQAGYSSSRAVLTARDQTLKLYGQVQQERQQNAGVERYIWTTSLDERVRPDHADLDGTVQRWDDPPIVDKRTGRRGHPGFDFQCRCTAVPVLDEPAEGEEPAEQQRQVSLRERAVAEGRFAAPPPREPAMVPTQAELDAERARRAAEASRLRLEREADARIAAAREAALANVPPAIAPRSAAHLVDLAQEAPRAAAKRAEVEAVVERGLVGKSLGDLRAIPFTAEQLATDESLAFLRQDPHFRRTGNVADNFGSSKGGLPQITIESDGEAYLSNGRHRITVARELGLRQIIAHVRKVGKRGGLLWDYVGPIRI